MNQSETTSAASGVAAEPSEAALHAAMDAFYPGEDWRTALGGALDTSLRDMRAALSAAALAAPTAKGGTEVPAGWKLVPEEPTQAMWAAYRNTDDGNILFHKAYRAMLAASPPPPAGAAGGSDVVSARLIPWEPGQKGVEITLTGGRSVAIPLSQFAGDASSSAVWTDPASPEAVAEIKAGMQSIQDFRFPGYVSFDGTYHGPSPVLAGAAGGGSGDLGALSAAVWALLREWDTADELPESLELRLSAFETAWLRFEGEAHRNPAPTPDLGAQGEPVGGETQGGWQPIETAPKDGTWIEAWIPKKTPEDDADFAIGGVDSVRWSGKGFWWSRHVGCSYPAACPTHWRPLPTPPSGVETIRQDNTSGGE